MPILGAMRPIALILPWALMGVGCSFQAGGLRPPAAALTPQPQSSLAQEVDEIVTAIGTGEVEALAEKMTPRLKGELSVTDLRRASAELRESFGEPRGIMEEQQSLEGTLTWFSSVVVFAKVHDDREVLTPVLYQFALTPERQLERLLIREHVFIDSLHAPADGYEPVTRFHVPTTGNWTVSQGGPTRELNAHHGSETQRFAYDLVLVLGGRFRDGSMPSDSNASYFGYGEPLLAPAAGTVVQVVEGVPDNVPKTMGKAGGNGLVIDHGFGEVSSLWHAKPGSVRVKEGDRVVAGQVVAQVGNSGRSSGAHIHVHLTRRDDPIALPMPFVDLRIDGEATGRALPIKRQKIEAQYALPTPPPQGPSDLQTAPPVAARPRVLINV